MASNMLAVAGCISLVYGCSLLLPALGWLVGGGISVLMAVNLARTTR